MIFAKRVTVNASKPLAVLLHGPSGTYNLLGDFCGTRTPEKTRTESILVFDSCANLKLDDRLALGPGVRLGHYRLFEILHRRPTGPRHLRFR